MIEACIRTKRLEEAVRYAIQIRSVSKIDDLLKLCYSENNVKAARLCQGFLGQLYSQNGAGKNESGSQYALMGRLWQLDAWLAERDQGSGR